MFFEKKQSGNNDFSFELLKSPNSVFIVFESKEKAEKFNKLYQAHLQKKLIIRIRDTDGQEQVMMPVYDMNLVPGKVAVRLRIKEAVPQNFYFWDENENKLKPVTSSRPNISDIGVTYDQFREKAKELELPDIFQINRVQRTREYMEKMIFQEPSSSPCILF